MKGLLNGTPFLRKGGYEKSGLKPQTMVDGRLLNTHFYHQKKEALYSFVPSHNNKSASSYMHSGIVRLNKSPLLPKQQIQIFQGQRCTIQITHILLLDVARVYNISPHIKVSRNDQMFQFFMGLYHPHLAFLELIQNEIYVNIKTFLH